MESAVYGIGDIHAHSSYDFQHQVGRLDADELILYICVGLKQAQLAECLIHASDRASFLVILDHDGGCACVGFWCTQQVDCSHAHAQDNGEDKP